MLDKIGCILPIVNSYFTKLCVALMELSWAATHFVVPLSLFSHWWLLLELLLSVASGQRQPWRNALKAGYCSSCCSDVSEGVTTAGRWPHHNYIVYHYC
jgi:hypothetical protein